jgi:hypothetical protein
VGTLREGLGALLLTDIACDLRGTDDDACRVSDRRHGYGDGETDAVLSAAYRFEMLDALIAADTVENRVLFVLMTLRNDEAYRLTNRFSCRVTEHTPPPDSMK